MSKKDKKKAKKQAKKDQQSANAIDVHMQDKNKFDKALDWAVERSGSIPVFVFTQSLLWTWVFLGTKFHTTDWWQVVISDAQAIYSYTLDSVILHQQLLDLDASRYTNGQLASRNTSKLRMMTELQRKFPDFLRDGTHDNASSGDKITMMDGFSTKKGEDDGPLVVHGERVPELPQEKWVASAIRKVSLVFGHLGAVGVFWIGFIIWISNGPPNDWSDQWQLYYNSACSAFMVLYVFYRPSFSLRPQIHAYTDLSVCLVNFRCLR